MKIKTICIDLDNYTTADQFSKVVEVSRERLSIFGEIIHDKPTKNGHHLKVRLNRQVSFWRSIEIRHMCGDDPQRMIFDILRYRAGSKIVDVCFDHKIKR